jgi:N-acetyl-gamma-glutamyl-phosphate reductase
VKRSFEGLYEDFYRAEPFVVVSDRQPSTKQVHGSNACVICPNFDERTGFAVITSVIDNLGKGAAGQAVQNMNLMFNLPETTGLTANGVWP